MRCWVIRTDPNRTADVIVPSLESGELRQGWAYLPEQDLNTIGPLVYEDGLHALTPDQRAAWRRVQRFWPEHWDPVAPGDLILLPKVPSVGHWRLVEVTGTYRYSRHPMTDDHGHILAIRTLISVIASSNVAVTARLQRTMRNRAPMWNVDGLKDDLQQLIAAGGQAAAPHGSSDRLAEVLNQLLTDFRGRISDSFRGNELEEPVFRLLQQLLPGAAIDKTAGPAEHGTNFVIETDVFGHARRTVVQLKDHDILSDRRSLTQIEDACKWHAPVTGAVVLTTARDEAPGFADEREALASGLGFRSPRSLEISSQNGSWPTSKPSPRTDHSGGSSG